jgi:MoaA/NifB/PqqE/SkfB family radical SAM enzyme
MVETLCIHITGECDLVCKHCWARDERGHTSFSDKQLYSFLTELQAQGLIHVSFSGGEPTLRKDLASLVDWCLSSGLLCSVTSNGFAPKRLADFFTQLRSCAQFHQDRFACRISIDGNKMQHDMMRGLNSFTHAVESLSICVKELGCAAVNSIAWEGLETSVDKLVPLLNGLEIKDWAFITKMPHGVWNTPEYDVSLAVERCQRCANKALKYGFTGRTRVWDYLSWPNTGFVVDSKGHVRSSSVVKASDVLIGYIGDNDIIKRMQEYVNFRRSASSKDFFSFDTTSFHFTKESFVS